MSTSDWINLATAIGTISATVTALWVALQGHQQRVDCVFMWETATGNKPTLILNNIGDRTVIVERVELVFRREKIASIDILRSSAYSDHAVISPKKEARIAIDPDILKLSSDSKPAKNPNTLYKLTAIVKTTSNKKYKSHYRYCYDELLGFIFLDAFDAE